MINFVACLLAFLIAILLSNVESLGMKEVKILTAIGWLMYILYFLGGGNFL